MADDNKIGSHCIITAYPFAYSTRDGTNKRFCNGFDKLLKDFLDRVSEYKSRKIVLSSLEGGQIASKN